MIRRRHGFSILEVLVAFVIMALVFAVLLPGQGDALARAQRSNDQLLAADILRSLTALERAPDIDPAQAGFALPPGWRMTRRLEPGISHTVVGTSVTLTIHGPYGRLLADRTIWRPSR